MKTLLTLLILLPLLPACNLMEGLHQFNPNYKNPIPLSSPWFDRLKAKKQATR
jgi:hypothetical protein